MLVLIDSRQNGEPLPVAEQRARLTQLLDAQDWRYNHCRQRRRVYQRHAQRRLRHPTYLLAERVGLSEQTQKELREAVYRGDALNRCWR